MLLTKVRILHKSYLLLRSWNKIRAGVSDV